MDELTAKQKRFCEEYVLDWNATQAAIRAGYSEKTAYAIGHENLRKPELQQYIATIQEDMAKLAGVSFLRNLNALKDIAYSGEAAGGDSDTEPTPYRIKAIETINKMLGFNAPDKLDHTTKGEALQPFDYTKLSDAALREIIAAASGDEPGGGAR
jgi:phage terminase small subunit